MKRNAEIDSRHIRRNLRRGLLYAFGMFLTLLVMLSFAFFAIGRTGMR